MGELRDGPRGDGNPSRTGSPYERSENHIIKSFTRAGADEKYLVSPRGMLQYQDKQEEYAVERRQEEGFLYPGNESSYRYTREEDFMPLSYDRPPVESALGSSAMGPVQPPRVLKEPPREARAHHSREFSGGRQFRSNSISGTTVLSMGRQHDHLEALGMRMAREAPKLNPGPIPVMRMFRKDDDDSGESDDVGSMQRLGNKGRKKIKMEFIKDKGRRGVTFSKRKKGIMKKAYELNVLTKCEILLVVASETGHVYTFATPKLQPIIKQHENLIQQYLNAPSPAEAKAYDGVECFSPENNSAYYKGDAYGYDGLLRTHGYQQGYYHPNEYDSDTPPPNGPRM